jgi:hypothetical protein
MPIPNEERDRIIKELREAFLDVDITQGSTDPKYYLGMGVGLIEVTPFQVKFLLPRILMFGIMETNPFDGRKDELEDIMSVLNVGQFSKYPSEDDTDQYLRNAKTEIFLDYSKRQACALKSAISFLEKFWVNEESSDWLKETFQGALQYWEDRCQNK